MNANQEVCDGKLGVEGQRVGNSHCTKHCSVVCTLLSIRTSFIGCWYHLEGCLWPAGADPPYPEGERHLVERHKVPKA